MAVGAEDAATEDYDLGEINYSQNTMELYNGGQDTPQEEPKVSQGGNSDPKLKADEKKFQRWKLLVDNNSRIMKYIVTTAVIVLVIVVAGGIALYLTRRATKKQVTDQGHNTLHESTSVTTAPESEFKTESIRTITEVSTTEHLWTDNDRRFIFLASGEVHRFPMNGSDWTTVNYESVVELAGDVLAGVGEYQTRPLVLHTPEDTPYPQGTLDIPHSQDALQLPKENICWMMLSAASAMGETLDVKVAGVTPGIGIRHASRTWAWETLHRDFLAICPPSEEVSVQYIGQNEPGVSTVWGGISLSAYMRPLAVLSVTRTSGWDIEGVIQFDKEVFNTWVTNDRKSIFTVPETGMYYCSVSVGLPVKTKAAVDIKVNGINRHRLQHLSTLHDGIEAISSSTLLELQQGDSLRLSLDGKLFSSDIYSETSLACFLYSTNSENNNVAWHIKKWADLVVFDYKGVTLKFEEHTILDGVSISADGKELNVQHTGIYYLHVNLYLDSGTSGLVVEILINGDTLENMQLITHTEHSNGIVGLNGSFIAEIEANSTLSVLLIARGSLLSSDAPSASFLGLRIV